MEISNTTATDIFMLRGFVQRQRTTIKGEINVARSSTHRVESPTQKIVVN
jgi:hypothetical protein